MATAASDAADIVEECNRLKARNPPLEVSYQLRRARRNLIRQLEDFHTLVMDIPEERDTGAGGLQHVLSHVS